MLVHRASQYAYLGRAHRSSGTEICGCVPEHCTGQPVLEVSRRTRHSVQQLGAEEPSNVSANGSKTGRYLGPQGNDVHEIGVLELTPNGSSDGSCSIAVI